MPSTHRILCRQIEAGRTLSRKLVSWDAGDHALRALADRFPEHDEEACLLKSTAINALYNTNVYALWPMAKHICHVIASSDGNVDPDLVDRLAKFEKWDRHSFASKYAHFFLGPERFPIYDQYIVRMLAYHRGSRGIWPTSYVEFYSWFEELKPLYEESFSLKEVDQYLWLAGMMRYKDQKGDETLGAEVKRLIKSADEDEVVRLALNDLL